MRSTKSQAKVFETIAILIIVSICIIGLMIFYANYKKISIQSEEEIKLEENAVSVMQAVINMHPLSCTSEGYKVKGCFDSLKLKEIIPDQLYYFDLLHYSTVYVTVLDTGEQLDIYNYQPDSINSKHYFFTPVSVYDPVEHRFYYSILTVEVYS